MTGLWNSLGTSEDCEGYKIDTKVPILKEVNFGKMQLCRVEHFYNIFVLTFVRDC